MTIAMNRAEQTRSRIAALQAWLVDNCFDGLFVPRADFWQGEEVMACDERLLWLTGFSGSAGMTLVLKDAAAVFVDGRYTLQVAEELKGTTVESRHVTDEPWQAWAKLPAKAKLAVDTKLVTGTWADRTQKALEAQGGSLVLIDSNPIDMLWVDQPAPSFTPVSLYPTALSGEDSLSKRQRLAAKLTEQGQQAALITDPTGIAWMLNIRAQDYAHTPVALSVALLRNDATVVWFTTPERDTPDLSTHIGAGCTITTPSAWSETFATLREQTVLVDENTAAAWLEQVLKSAGAAVQRGICITALAKAQKNKLELDGMRSAQRRDGAAFAKFLNWYDQTIASGSSQLMESDITRKLAEERAFSNAYHGPSFETICGFGAHGASAHYRTTDESDITVNGNGLLLLDSGGQYNDGTTDITRTLPVGMPSDAQRRAYTRVLKGHVALAMARFPAGTTGHQLDALARAPLWDAGMDYEHGTGHGVGHYLSVHEGPARITKHAFAGAASLIPLLPGMVFSNEPAYYEPGAYGVRIETMMAVVEGEQGTNGKPFLEFETLTSVPYARDLILVDLLTMAERNWIDAYHARVLAEIDDKDPWLEQACAPL